MASETFVPIHGYEVIDYAHQRIDELIAQARDLAEGGEGFRTKLDEFRHFVGHHFTQENVMMRATSFPQAVKHAELHAAMLARIDGYSDTPLEDRSARLSLVRILERMLWEHEIKDDAAFHDHYERLGGATAQWSDALLTGLAWQDEEHRGIFAEINGIDQIIRQGSPVDTVGLGLKRFVALARKHFEHEEHELAVLKPDLKASHQVQHAALLRDLSDLMAAIDDGSSALLAIDFLKFWVVDHIKRVDLEDFGVH